MKNFHFLPFYGNFSRAENLYNFVEDFNPMILKLLTAVGITHWNTVVQGRVRTNREL